MPGRRPAWRGTVSLTRAQLGVPAGQRRLQPVDALRSAHGGDDRLRPVQPHRLGLALQHVLTHVGVGDRGLRQARVSASTHTDARRRRGLHPGRGVDRVAGHHALPDRPSVTATDPVTTPTRSDRSGSARRLPQRRHLADQVEPRADRPLGVVLVGDRDAPHRHHRVADELLDRPAVATHDRARPREVGAQQLAHVLGVTALGQCGERDQVREEHRRRTSLRDRRAKPRCGMCGLCGRPHRRVQRRPALGAEPTRHRRVAAGGTDPGQW